MKNFIKHIKTNYKLILPAVIIGLLIGWLLKPSGNGPIETKESHNHNHTTTEKAPTIWTCSMHPQIKQDHPGDCPICGMELIPMNASKSHENADPNEIAMSESALQLANVQTSKVMEGEAVRDAFLQGKIEADERNIAKLTARFGGRIEQLYVNFTGQTVKKGQALASIYSPGLISAQRELIEASNFKDSNPGLYWAAKAKLKAWDLTDAQIAQIESAKEPSTNFKVLSPISGTVIMRHVAKGDYIKEGMDMFQIVDLNKVWLMLDAYETDLPWVKVGDPISFSLQAQPGVKFEGKVAFIDPLINPQTRVAKVRAEVNNADGLLKPEMFVSAKVLSTLKQDHKAIIIPKSAVLWTGKRAVVYVKVADREEPAFLYREITLGPEAGDSYVVANGLKTGEEIATNGVFKIDAAAQLEGKNSMMNASMSDQHHMQMADAHFQVSGNCDMCKETIEKAALSVEGVSQANWNKNTKTLGIKYNTEQAQLEHIHQAIAESGYDTEKAKAKAEVYNQLPECCHYVRGDFGTLPGELASTSFKVYGNCDMCKERIEEAAMGVSGVKSAQWDTETKILNLTTEESLNILRVHKAIAQVGHDTDKEKALKAVYDQLPECCLYSRP